MTPLELEACAHGLDGQVVVRGEIDMATAPQLQACLDELVDGGVRKIRLDCHALEFLDSSGIAVLVAVRKRLGDDGSVVLASPPAHVRRALEVTGIAPHISIVQ